MGDQLQPEAPPAQPGGSCGVKTELVSPVCGTWRMEFVLKREDINKCVKNEVLTSEEYSININGLDTKWCIGVYPRGSEDFVSEDAFAVEMKRLSCGSYEGVIWGAFTYAVKTADGYQPDDFESQVSDVNNVHAHIGLLGWQQDVTEPPGRSEPDINISDDICYDNDKLTLIVIVSLRM